MNTPRATPLWFGPETRPLFGMLHRTATEPTHGLGVIVCNPFGYEAICAHRSMRHLAEALARGGVPTLRFDYDGTGDSAGSDWDDERLAAWVRSVHLAIDELVARAGVARVALVGCRFGAIPATLGALGRDDVAGLAVVAPVLVGKAYLRELKALQLALHLGDPPADVKGNDGIQEAIGFVLTPETRSSLGAVDLHKLEQRPASSVLLVDRDDFPPNDKWARHLESLGAAVARRRLPGCVEMMLDPHKTRIPTAIVEAVVDWARDLAKTISPTAAPADADAHRSRALLAPVSERGLPIEEHAVYLDDERTLFGIVSAPAIPDPGSNGHARKKAIVWLNAGSIAHIGPNRMTVTLARKWASQGHTVLRMDVSGIGESLPRRGEPENVVYTERTREDTHTAIEFLRKRGAHEVHGIGLCSGAYNAFKGAVAGQPFDGVVLVNPATFFWKEGMSLDFEYRESRVKREATRYKRAALDPRSWVKLAKGEVKVDALVQVLSRRAASAAEASLREVARRVGRPLPEDLGAELEVVAKRRIPMFFVFASGDPGLELLHTQGGSAARRLRARQQLKLALVDGPDHTFTPVWAQDKLAAILDAHFASTTPERG